MRVSSFIFPAGSWVRRTSSLKWNSWIGSTIAPSKTRRRFGCKNKKSDLSSILMRKMQNLLRKVREEICGKIKVKLQLLKAKILLKTLSRLSPRRSRFWKIKVFSRLKFNHLSCLLKNLKIQCNRIRSLPKKLTR